MHNFNTYAFFGLCVIVGFDVRDESAGLSLYQAAVVVGVLFAGCVVVSRVSIKRLFYDYWFLLLVVTWTFVSLILGFVEIVDWAGFMLKLFYFGSAFVAVSLVGLNSVCVFCLVSVSINYLVLMFNGFGTYGFSLFGERHMFESFFVVGFPIAFVLFLSRPSLPLGSFLGLVISFAAVTYTRMNLVVVAFALFVVSVKSFFGGNVKGLVFMALGVLVAGVCFVSNESVRERWLDRVEQADSSGMAMDPTVATRMAEIEGMYDVLKGAPVKMFLGAGPGARYFLSTRYDAEIRYAYGKGKEYYLGLTYPGHNMFVYVVFAYGLVCGGCILVFLAIVFFRTLKAMFFYPGGSDGFALALASLCVFLSSIVANHANSRFTMFWVGGVWGVMFYFKRYEEVYK